MSSHLKHQSLLFSSLVWNSAYPRKTHPSTHFLPSCYHSPTFFTKVIPNPFFPITTPLNSSIFLSPFSSHEIRPWHPKTQHLLHPFLSHFLFITFYTHFQHPFTHFHFNPTIIDLEQPIYIVPFINHLVQDKHYLGFPNGGLPLVLLPSLTPSLSHSFIVIFFFSSMAGSANERKEKPLASLNGLHLVYFLLWSLKFPSISLFDFLTSYPFQLSFFLSFYPFPI